MIHYRVDENTDQKPSVPRLCAGAGIRFRQVDEYHDGNAQMGRSTRNAAYDLSRARKYLNPSRPVSTCEFRTEDELTSSIQFDVVREMRPHKTDSNREMRANNANYVIL